jgi:phospholipid/cholesterol/gamma-HCH transport system ATP-binding protein
VSLDGRFSLKNKIEIQNLRFNRGERMIFDGVDLVVPEGKITAIMGPSGTGKTTLLRFMTGLLKPDAGDVLLDGKSVPKASHDELNAMRQKMGMLFQNGALFTDMSVLDNVAFALREHTQLPERLIRDLALLKLEAVGLRGAHALMPRELSGGMNRRVALARSIALDPEVIMYDEPFAGQDPISMGVLIRLIKQLHETLGLTSIIVSHDIAETASIADYIYLIANGKVIGQGTPQELADSTSPQVRQFMRGEADGPVPFDYPGVPLSIDLWGGA